MAFTYTVAEKTVFGNLQVHMATVVADATAGAVATGLGTVAHVTVSPKSVTSGYKVAANAGVSGTSTVGTVAITGCTSGDEFYVTVYGR
jgi:hypothetical protein